MLISLLIVLNIIVAILLALFVLLQRAEDGLGGAFGGGAGGNFSGGKNALTRATAILGAIFMGSCLLLAALSVGAGRGESVVEGENVLVSDLPAIVPLADPQDIPAPIEMPSVSAEPEMPKDSQ